MEEVVVAAPLEDVGAPVPLVEAKVLTPLVEYQGDCADVGLKYGGNTLDKMGAHWIVCPPHGQHQ